jgi:hypothetical protein
MADLGGELVEVPSLDGLQPVGYAMQRRVLGRVVPDARGRALGLGPVALEAGPDTSRQRAATDGTWRSGLSPPD